jgi:hypothetical protein
MDKGKVRRALVLRGFSVRDILTVSVLQGSQVAPGLSVILADTAEFNVYIHTCVTDGLTATGQTD